MLCCDLLQCSFMLGGPTDVNLVVVYLNFEAGWKEGVEADDEVWVASEEVGDSADDSWSVDTVGGGGGGREGRRGEGRGREKRGRGREGERGGRRERKVGITATF